MTVFDSTFGQRPLLSAVLSVAFVAIGIFLVKLYRVRTFFRRLQKQGLVCI